MAADVAFGVGDNTVAEPAEAGICRARLGRRRRAKRIVDLVASLAIFVPWLAACLAVAALVRAVDGGPALFWQERVGLEGRTFRMPKFRTS